MVANPIKDNVQGTCNSLAKPGRLQRRRRNTVTTAAPHSHTPPRVLLCEDEGLTVMMLRKALKTHGFAVVAETSTAQEAVYIATSTPLDLILMDVNLQGQMDGIEAARQILAHHFVPIIMLTAIVEQEQVQRAFDAGASGYISKPVTSQNLIPMLTAILTQTPVAQNIDEARARFNAVSGTDRFNSTPAVPTLPL
jgi:CheY-like chemotaxis protein